MTYPMLTTTYVWWGTWVTWGRWRAYQANYIRHGIIPWDLGNDVPFHVWFKKGKMNVVVHLHRYDTCVCLWSRTNFLSYKLSKFYTFTVLFVYLFNFNSLKTNKIESTNSNSNQFIQLYVVHNDITRITPSEEISLIYL